MVIKTRRHEKAGWGGERGYLDTEQRALTLLGETGVPCAPRLLAFDDAAGVLVMEDLTPARSIQELLSGTDGIQSMAALVALAARTGAMHAASRPIASGAWHAHSIFERDVRERWRRLVAAANQLSFPDPAPAAMDVEALIDALPDARWRTLTHGDITPGNAVICDSEVRLVDFEGAGPRHACLDGAAFRLCFPQYGQWAAIPPDIVAAMDRAYRRELARGVPLAENEAAYNAAMATGCAAWAIVRLSRLSVIATEDQDPVEKLRRRTQIVHTVESGVTTARQANAYPALTAWLNAVTGEMRRRWPEVNAEPRRFPAFAPATPGDTVTVA